MISINNFNKLMIKINNNLYKKIHPYQKYYKKIVQLVFQIIK
jgi:hypothetical protein